MSALATFRDETRVWLAENCPQSVRQLGYIPIGSTKIELELDTKLWLDRMVDKGWTTPTWPKEYGGAGLSKEEYTKNANDLRKKVIKHQQDKRASLDKITKQRSIARQTLLKELDPILKSYVEENGLSLVLDKKTVLAGNTGLDITDAIVEKLNKALPSLNLK